MNGLYFNIVYNLVSVTVMSGALCDCVRVSKFEKGRIEPFSFLFD